MSRSRAWCVTSFEDTPPDFKAMYPKVKYFIIGSETCPKTGKHHWQCYFYNKDAIRFSSLKKALPTAHLAIAKGTPEQNRKYCSKEEIHSEFGDLPAQGKRTDIGEFMSVALSGRPVDSKLIADFPAEFAKYHKAYDRALLAVQEEKKAHEPVEVIVFMGTAGSGKTRKAYELYPDLFQVTDFNWWDGYHGQETILFDDFYGDCKYGMLLRLLDRYQFRLPVKGGFTWKAWKRVIITSNDHPDGWYKKGLTPALKRRLTRVEEMKDMDDPDNIPLSQRETQPYDDFDEE